MEKYVVRKQTLKIRNVRKYNISNKNRIEEMEIKRKKQTNKTKPKPLKARTKFLKI